MDDSPAIKRDRPILHSAPVLLRRVLACATLLTIACYRPTYEIEIVVHNAKTNAAVAGAQVVVAGRGWGRGDYVVWDREYKVSGLTDAQGRFRAKIRSAPYGIPTGGQQPHAVRVKKSGFDPLYTTVAVEEDRLVGHFALEEVGTASRMKQQREEEQQMIRTLDLDLEADRVVAEVTLKSNVTTSSTLLFKLELGGFDCGAERIAIENNRESLHWTVDPRSLLECYIKKSRVRGKAMADVFLRVEAEVEETGGLRSNQAIRIEKKVELDFLSDDPAEWAIRQSGDHRSPTGQGDQLP